MLLSRLNTLSQRVRVVIEIDLQQDNFNVSIENLSARKGFVDFDAMKLKLKEIMTFMIKEGNDSLIDDFKGGNS